MEIEEKQLSVEYMFSNGRFNSPEEFSVFIETQAVKKNERYLNVIMDFCEDNDIEPEVVAKSLTPSLSEKLEAECKEYHLLKGTKSNKLPE